MDDKTPTPNSNITSPDELEEWLKDKPKEWAQVIALRVALRALPFFFTEWLSIDVTKSNQIGITKACFRVILLSSISQRFQNYNFGNPITLGAEIIHSLIQNTKSNLPAHTYVFAAAGYAQALAGANEHAVDASQTAYAIDASYKNTHKKHWPAIQQDISYLTYREKTHYLQLTPIWTIFPNSVREHLELFKSHVWSNKDENWQVWLDWYDAMLHGHQPFGLSDEAFKPIAFEIAKKDNDWWEQDIAIINGEFTQLVDKAKERAKDDQLSENTLDIEALPQQNPSAMQMGVNEEGKVDSIDPPDINRLLKTPDQEDDYNYIREQLQSLRQQGQNLLGPLHSPLGNLLVEMPDVFEQANTRKLWRAGIKLRKIHKAHMAVKELEEYHEAKLDPAIAEDLSEILSSYNNFSFNDPDLRKRDLQSVSPQEQISFEEETELLNPLIDEVIKANIVTPLVHEEFLSVNSVDKDDVSPYGKQEQILKNETIKNFFAATITFLGRHINTFADTIAKEGGKWTVRVGFTYAIYQFVLQNIDSLLLIASKVFSNPHAVKLFEMLAKLIS